jgi:hypothetical protein
MKPSQTDSRRRRLLVRSLASSPLDDLSPFDLAIPDDPLSLAVHSPPESGEDFGVDDPSTDSAVETAAPVLSRLDAVLLALRPTLPESSNDTILRIPAKIDVLVQDAAVLRRRIQQLAEQLDAAVELPSEAVQEAWDDCRRLAGFVYWELDRGLPLPESRGSGNGVRKAR